MKLHNKYILLDILLCSIAEYFYWVVPHFDKPVGLVKIQTTIKNSQIYYTAKGLITNWLFNMPNFYVRTGEFHIIYGEWGTQVYQMEQNWHGISLSSNCFSSYDFSDKLESIFASHSGSSSSENQFKWSVIFFVTSI